MYEIYASNQVFQEIFYASPSPMWVMDAETFRFLAVNHSATALYGYSRTEFLGMKSTQVRLPADRDEFERTMRACKENSQQSGLLQHIGKNEKKIYVDVVRQRINFDGHPAWLVMLRDLTQQTVDARLLAEAEKKYRVLVEESLVGIYTLKGSTISYANPRFAQIFGYTQEEVKGKDVLDFISESDKAEAMKGIQLRLNGDTSERLYVRSAQRKDGQIITVELRTAQIITEDGPLTFGFVLDVTETTLAQQKITAQVNQLRLALEQTVEAISTMGELRDPYTTGHEQRTATIAEAIGMEMGLSGDVLAGIRVGSILHDIGKVAIPIEILIKPSRLTQGEYSIIQTHSQSSYDILKDIEFKWPVAKVVLQHHERLDGTGYPNGVKDNEILLETRIVTVADVVESMAMNRPYRAGLGVDKALAEIKKLSGTAFDPDVVSACVTLIRDKGYQLPHH